MAADTYTDLPIETDSYELAQLSFDYMADHVPGWEPHDGQIDSWLISALAQQAAELRDVAADIPRSIFRYFGASMMNIAPLNAVAASAPVTMTVKDSVGYTIPAGYTAGVRDASGTLHGFVTPVDVIIPAGSTTGDVTMIAVEEGADASGLGANGTAMELITSLDDVTAVTMTASSSGGVDAEDDDVYLDRLTRDLSLQAPRPILPGDFALFALNIPGVARAIAIDGWDDTLGTDGHERTITVVVVDSDGEPVGTLTKSTVHDTLVALREVNFVVYVTDPTYTTVDITYTATAYSGWDTASVEAAIDDALTSYLEPKNWGQAPASGAADWSQRAVVKQLDLAAVIGNVQGVKDVNTVTFRTGTDPFATDDINLAGVAPLTRPGAVTGTVS